MQETIEGLRHDLAELQDENRALRKACDQLAERVKWHERKPPITGVAAIHLVSARKTSPPRLRDEQ